MNVQSIAEKIQEIYLPLKKLERQQSVLKEAMKKHLSDTTEVINENGLILQYKKRSKATYKEEFYDLLDEEAKLPLAIKIEPSLEDRFLELYEFRDKHKEYYIHPYPKRRTKDQIKKDQEEEDTQLFLLNEQSLHELVAAFRTNKLEYEMLNQSYDRLKTQLLAQLEKENKEEAISSNGMKLKIREKKPTYDLDRIFASKFNKQMFLLYLCHDGNLEVFNPYTKKYFHFSLDEPMKLEGHDLSLRDNKLYVDGLYLENDIHLEHFKDDTLEEIHSFLLKGAQSISGIIPCNSEQFFRSCPISSTNIESLLDSTFLVQSVVDQHKIIKSEKDISIHFEVIEESVAKERKEYFYQKIMKRSETLREREVSSEQTDLLNSNEESEEELFLNL